MNRPVADKEAPVASDTREKYYRESGIVPIYAPPIMVLAAIATAMITSPLIALTSIFCGGCAALGVVFGIGFLVPVFHSVVIGTVVRTVGQTCAVRRRSFVRAVWFIGALIAFYFFLHAHVWFHTGAGWERFLPLLRPSELFRETMDGFRQLPTVSVVVICIFLCIFLLMYLFPLIIPMEDDSEPYCEACQCFTACHPQVVEFKFLTTKAFEEGYFASLWPFTPHGATTQFFRAKLYECPQCEESSYMRVWQIDRWPDIANEEMGSETVQLVVDLLSVPPNVGNVFDRLT